MTRVSRSTGPIEPTRSSRSRSSELPPSGKFAGGRHQVLAPNDHCTRQRPWRRGWSVFRLWAPSRCSMRVTKPGPHPRRPSTAQITNFTDSATAPTLSPDGRMVTFIRGGEAFLSRGQIYVKLLPDGDAVPLTTGQPAQVRSRVHAGWFPDRVYPALRHRRTREQHMDGPGPGRGRRALFLPNASGLTWLSTISTSCSRRSRHGLHMGIVTATESRAQSRAIYFPTHERGMGPRYASRRRIVAGCSSSKWVRLTRSIYRAVCCHSMEVPPAGRSGRGDTAPPRHGRRMDSGCNSAPRSGAVRTSGASAFRTAFRSRSPLDRAKRKGSPSLRTDVR